MHKKTISELEEVYDLELEKIMENIKKQKAGKVLLQFPDGMKPYATTIVNELEMRCRDVSFLIWFGSCFGACDVPEAGDVDLVVQFGHSEWKDNKR